jgi:hypothetical protein
MAAAATAPALEDFLAGPGVALRQCFKLNAN